MEANWLAPLNRNGSKMTQTLAIQILIYMIIIGFGTYAIGFYRGRNIGYEMGRRAAWKLHRQIRDRAGK